MKLFLYFCPFFIKNWLSFMKVIAKNYNLVGYDYGVIAFFCVQNLIKINFPYYSNCRSVYKHIFVTDE